MTVATRRHLVHYRVNPACKPARACSTMRARSTDTRIEAEKQKTTGPGQPWLYIRSHQSSRSCWGSESKSEGLDEDDALHCRLANARPDRDVSEGST
jgi:hypothetical protein